MLEMVYKVKEKLRKVKLNNKNWGRCWGYSKNERETNKSKIKQ